MAHRRLRGKARRSQAVSPPSRALQRLHGNLHLQHPAYDPHPPRRFGGSDRKSTRLNSSHSQISYAVFCLKKKKEHYINEKSPTTPKSLPEYFPFAEFDLILKTLLNIYLLLLRNRATRQIF